MPRALLVAAVAATCLLAPSSVSAATLEPVELNRLALPAGVSGMSHPDWTPDGDHIVAGFTSLEQPAAQLGLIRADGSGFRCLTCGLAQVQGLDRPFNLTNPLALDKPYVFGDGRRVLARIVSGREDRGDATPISLNSGPTQDFNSVVLECSPSLLDCRDRSLVALQYPGGGLTRGVQNREARISPDSRFLAWTEVQLDGTRMSMGRLERASDHYELAHVRVLNPAFELRPPDPSGFRLGGPLYELKNFAPDGRTVTYATFENAENYDVWRLDLATGQRRRLTSDLEWNEGTTASPDNGSFVNFSSRTRNRMSPFALVPRPPFIDFATYVLLGRFALSPGNRKCLLSPWLVDARGERGGYFGQPIDFAPAPGFAPHGNGPFSRDGTRVVFWEFDDDAAATPAEPDAHIVVATLPARKPAPLSAVPQTPEPVWAVPREQWSGYTAQQGTFVVNGPGGGTATIELNGVTNVMDWSVNFDGYSEDGRTRLTGSEAVFSPFTTQYGRWTADLKLEGAQSGVLKADVEVRSGGRATGTLETELDGRRLEGLPGPRCEPLATPRLRVRMHSRRGRRLTLRVVADVPGDRAERPVRHVLVRAAGRAKRTDKHGFARLRIRPRAHLTVRADADGFAPARLTLTNKQR